MGTQPTVPQPTAFPLTSIYNAHKANIPLRNDPHQEDAVETLQKLGESLVSRFQNFSVKSDDELSTELLLSRWKVDVTTDAKESSHEENLEDLASAGGAPMTAPKGKYIFGSVGTGKTMMMDLFWRALTSNENQPGLSTVPNAKRIHFHEFMVEMHANIHKLRMTNSKQHEPHIHRHRRHFHDPIDQLALTTSYNTPILCLDEFQLTDIGDAMLLRRFLKTAIGSGLVLIVTSNRAPDELYEGGLNRGLVLPLVKLIKESCEVINMSKGPDHRRLATPSITHRNIFHPSTSKSKSEFQTQDEASHAFIMDYIISSCGGLPSGSINTMTDIKSSLSKIAPSETIILSSRRKLLVPHVINNSALIPFSSLCGPNISELGDDSQNSTYNQVRVVSNPLGAADYLILCRRYNQIHISGPLLKFQRLQEREFDSGEDGDRNKNSLVSTDIDAGKRFITLVDVAYECGTRIVVEAVGGVEEVLEGLAGFMEDDNQPFDSPAAESKVLAEGGSSSSKATTFIGNVEWSATGLQEASLARIGRIGIKETGFSVARAASRLIEMGSVEWNSVAGAKRSV
ncbi:Envelope glycoprotein [Blyttiomyces sp. JEL0837]|nr:Envelope glycoprotein [Blyttiomyces sp. JEL0837]